MSSLIGSLSCKGSSSISVSDRKGSSGSSSGPKASAPLNLRDMTEEEEEEERPLAEYFEKRGHGKKFKKLVAKLRRMKRGKTALVNNPEGGPARAFEDPLETGHNTEETGGAGNNDEIVAAPVQGGGAPPKPQPRWTKSKIRKTFFLSW